MNLQFLTAVRREGSVSVYVPTRKDLQHFGGRGERWLGLVSKLALGTVSRNNYSIFSNICECRDFVKRCHRRA